MSRSEHATRRDPRDPGDLERKRLIKAFIEAERASPRRPVPPTDPCGVEISIRDAGPYVHYPASAEDLRAVLARLPLGVSDGLDIIAETLSEDGVS